MTLRLTILLLSVSALVAGDLPPMPPKTYVRVKPASQGAGAKALLTPKVIVPPARPMVLAWNWTGNALNPASNIVFLVRSNAVVKPCAPALSWKVVASTTATRWTNTVNKSAVGLVLFSVTASNRVTQLESGFATR
jgi:hypothetical protein